jgi:hypothetical protein
MLPVQSSLESKEKVHVQTVLDSGSWRFKELKLSKSSRQIFPESPVTAKYLWLGEREKNFGENALSIVGDDLIGLLLSDSIS